MQALDIPCVLNLILTLKNTISVLECKKIFKMIEDKINFKLNKSYFLILHKNDLQILECLKSINLVEIGQEIDYIERGPEFKKFHFEDLERILGKEELKIIIDLIFDYFHIEKNKKQIVYKDGFRICICGSMKALNKMLQIEKMLKHAGHEVIMPELIHEKTKGDLINTHFEKIKLCDAILIVNPEIKNIPGYIGGNSFLEIGFAYMAKKDVYLLHEIPKMSYEEEMIAMKPIILHGDLSLIK